MQIISESRPVDSCILMPQEFYLASDHMTLRPQDPGLPSAKSVGANPRQPFSIPREDGRIPTRHKSDSQSDIRTVSQVVKLSPSPYGMTWWLPLAPSAPASKPTSTRTSYPLQVGRPACLRNRTNFTLYSPRTAGLANWAGPSKRKRAVIHPCVCSVPVGCSVSTPLPPTVAVERVSRLLGKHQGSAAAQDVQAGHSGPASADGDDNLGLSWVV